MWDFEERLNIADDVNLTVFSTSIAISRGKNPMVSTEYHNLYLLLQLISGMSRKEKHWTSNFFHLPRTTFILKNILIVVNSQIGAGVGQIMRLIAITTSVLCAVHWQNSKKHTAEYKWVGKICRAYHHLSLFFKYFAIWSSEKSQRKSYKLKACNMERLAKEHTWA